MFTLACFMYVLNLFSGLFLRFFLVRCERGIKDRKGKTGEKSVTKACDLYTRFVYILYPLSGNTTGVVL